MMVSSSTLINFFCYSSLIVISLFVRLSVHGQTISSQWIISEGGQGHFLESDIISDLNGNVFVAGAYTGNVEMSGIALQPSFVYSNIFCAKYDAGGSLVWANSFGGTEDEKAISIGIDDLGNIFLTGCFKSPQVIIGNDTLFNLTGNNQHENMFLIKYSNDGNIIWTKSFGGTSGLQTLNNITPADIKVDSIGNIFLTGFVSADTTYFDSITLVNHLSNSTDLFIAKLDSAGTMQWAKNYGSIGLVNAGGGKAIELDAQGNIYLVGNFIGAFNFGTFYISANSFWNFFLAKMDYNGNIHWAKTLSSEGYIDAVLSDDNGYVYLAGHFTDPMMQLSNNQFFNYGAADIFIAKTDSFGNVIWAKSYGGTGNDVPLTLFTDISGHVFVAGPYSSPTLILNDTLVHWGCQISL
jgi:hypothetical protein